MKLTLIQFLLTESDVNRMPRIKEQLDIQLRRIHEQYPDAYVTYTELPKFGANPKSIFNTPLGIYAYPLEYVLEGDLEVPFAGDQPYMFIFRQLDNSRMLNLTYAKKSEFQQRISKAIEQVLPGQHFDDYQIHNNGDIWKEMYNAVYRYLTKTEYTYNPDDEPKGPYNTLTRKILMTAGYDSVLDTGYGIIYDNEPTQAVFFNIKNLEVVDMIRNKPIHDLDIAHRSKITSREQWMARMTHAIATQHRDRTAENMVGKFFSLRQHDADVLYRYANRMKTRIPAFELYILQDHPEFALKYAMNIIKGPWTAAEKLILSNPRVHDQYQEFLSKL